ncbi:hypothetical protein HanPSC8_Chr08g0334561 [Helianthus annuus]|nr:hypothetical protein HanPSC8_Chr08g0334561 [Helianthus annuus]
MYMYYVIKKIWDGIQKSARVYETERRNNVLDLDILFPLSCKAL